MCGRSKGRKRRICSNHHFVVAVLFIIETNITMSLEDGVCIG